MTREVTERDLRAPEFRQGSPEDYEIRDDGKIVRKDRFVCGMHDLAAIVLGSSRDYEIKDVIDAVHRLKGIQVLEHIRTARDVFEGEPKALECLEYLQALIEQAKEQA